MALIKLKRKTSDSLSLYLDGLDTGWTIADGQRIAKWYLSKGIMPNGESFYQYKKEVEIKEGTDIGVTSGGDVTFTGLLSGEEYGVRCEIYHGTKRLATLEDWFETAEGNILDNFWSWTSSNGNATAAQTRDAQRAIVNKEPTRNFSHKVWNDLVDYVYALINATHGAYWDESYASYDATRMSGSGEFLYAYQFNSLRNNLELVGKRLQELTGWYIGTILDCPRDAVTQGAIPHPVKSGDIIYGHYFTTLTDYLNICLANQL